MATNEIRTQKVTEKKKGSSKGISAALVIILCFVVAICIFQFVFGNPTNFIGNDRANLPLQGNLLGTIYKGGFVIPIIMTMLLSVIVLSIERIIAIGRCKGKGNLTTFVANIKDRLEAEDIQGARELCAKQKGSVAAVVRAGIDTYDQMIHDTTGLSKEQKALSISKTIEEATALEMPTMNQNLPVIATFSNLGTLTGLFGTVLGMIRSFSALSSTGGTDSAALSVGISEALVNTAFGILTGALAIIAYNYFTAKIDNITYAIDEIGFSIVNVFQARHS
ncbi:MAG TPA: flagellar motor protein MotA [Porphyromonadaceae bacterium]|jgi:biopolymer transport protein ExbB|uniref:MotA/TolQ/ExbB proton channel family protein n=1 Tax=Limibacterium fermenti TaxID=3229863 RepID=UPI000E8A28C1|nr:flagellar motor protein MotA [Porphyromonadaceae bacterium]HBL33562.1 flagellar motor protein MotA [Porphyromonadaceae bacterium]HBX45707.1 flagellar motor protein MotA [Porphyromonadaceae bacterium]HCM20366.1 flagellar motor protein MotA [Porphyromonadaceae bacterium]